MFVSTYWKYFSLIEFLIILILTFLLFLKKKNISKTESDFLYQAKNSEINMNDVILDINNSKILYKQLSKKCHPDLFISTPIHQEMVILFQKISESRRNYHELEKLKEIPINEYKIEL